MDQTIDTPALRHRFQSDQRTRRPCGDRHDQERRRLRRSSPRWRSTLSRASWCRRSEP